MKFLKVCLLDKRRCLMTSFSLFDDIFKNLPLVCKFYTVNDIIDRHHCTRDIPGTNFKLITTISRSWDTNVGRGGGGAYTPDFPYRVTTLSALPRNSDYRTENYFLPAIMKIASENNASFVFVRCFIQVMPPK